MRISIPAVLATAFVAACCTACDKKTYEGDLQFISYSYHREHSAYAAADSKNRVGESFAIALNAAPHLKIHGSWCELTWTESKTDGSKEASKVCFPISNIHSFKWKE